MSSGAGVTTGGLAGIGGAGAAATRSAGGSGPARFGPEPRTPAVAARSDLVPSLLADSVVVSSADRSMMSGLENDSPDTKKKNRSARRPP